MIDSISSSNLLLQPQDDTSSDDDENGMNLGGILNQVIGDVEKLLQDVLEQAQASSFSSSADDTDALSDDGTDVNDDTQDTFPNVDVSSLLQQLQDNFRTAQLASNQNVQL